MKTIWAGRIISWFAGFFVLTSGINLIFIRSADLMQNMVKFGFPESVLPCIGWAALISSLLYLIPKTSLLGAILLTGYLGGAVATHIRVGDGVFFAPILFGILIWLGLYLRNERLRTLVSLRG